MIIHPTYGPQVDPTDGTIGETKLVKRWLILRLDGTKFHSSQGRYSYETQKDCQNDAETIINTNLDREDCKGLKATEFWCYPIHFDPVCQVPK